MGVAVEQTVANREADVARVVLSRPGVGRSAVYHGPKAREFRDALCGLGKEAQEINCGH
jgi:adenosyl cobinamide kinase/adenosyl cobinamide phosphate guanylyltransferase